MSAQSDFSPAEAETVRFKRNTNPPKRRGCLGRVFWFTLLMVLVLGAGVALVSGTLVYARYEAELQDSIAALDAARGRETFQTTRIYDRNGELLWEIFGEGNRTQVDLSAIPQELINATIAVEDDTFYENIGLDAPSLVAALIANLRDPEGRPVGGSTITQQIVRHIAFDYEERVTVSYDRKIKEIVLAWLMNREYSKDEILAMYLNEIYYGNLAYGVEAAAQTYFAKSVTELTLAEISLLTALPQSPVDLDPLTNLQGAKDRQWLVLMLMVDEGYTTMPEAEAAYQTPLVFAPQEVSLQAPHFSVWVRQQLEQQYGAEMVANGGLKVTTTIDLRYQELAENVARQHVSALAVTNNLTNAAIVALKPGTGEVIAMLGSVDYQNEGIDGHVNIALSPQQPGSSIKPLTYAAALSPDPTTGQPAWSAADILWDVPVDYPQFDGSEYTPVNYDGRFHGPVRLRAALANSYNIPAILLLQDIGVPDFLTFARQMGIESWDTNPNNYGLSLTLGGGDVTPLELTSAYSVFANGGYRIPPVAILRVEKSDGTVLFNYETPAPQPVLDPRVAFLISDILDDDVARIPAMGRENPLNVPFPAAAKTGTTNDFRDNWTMGYTPGLVVGVWTGNTDNSEMVDVSGLTGAAPLWSTYMQAVYANPELVSVLASNGAQPPSEFVPPPGLEERPLCDIGSVTVGAVDCVRSGSEWFLTASNMIPTPAPDPNFVAWQQIEPAVWRIPAVTLPPLPAEILLGQTPDPKAPPAQLYCHFVQGTDVLVLPPGAAATLFLSPPRNPESLKAAHEWAQANNVLILPSATCTEELLALAIDPNAPAVWRITSPLQSQSVSGILPIVGVANFNPQEVQFYKVELGIPNGNDVQWVTLGETHNTPVVNGTLETFHADAFPAGSYFLRLIVVLWDGNYVGEPHTIPITIGPAS